MKRLLTFILAFLLIGCATSNLEKKADVAQECRYSQRAVDCYLKDYHRVKTAYVHKQDLDYIHMVTGIAQHVVKEYVEIINHNNF